MAMRFKPSTNTSIGVEIELGLINSESLELSMDVPEMLRRLPTGWEDSIKPEFMRSYLEFNTGVCQTVDEVRRDLSEKLQWGYETAAEMGNTFLWSGTHPTSHWKDQKLTDDERYEWLMETMQFVARRLVVFGLHVHIGVDSGDKAIQMCDRLLRHLPVLLALSSNSPHWCGRNTGLHSYRSKVMESLPTAGLPETMRNWSEYNWLTDHLIATDFIHSPREIWWDVRPVARFGTVEIRVMDTPMTMEHLLGLVAMTQCIVSGLSSEIDRGMYLVDCHPMIARQNKWHAARYGLDATLADPDTMHAIPARQQARLLLDLCQPLSEKLGCAEELSYVERILENGSGAATQHKVAKDTGDLKEVIRTTLDVTGKPWEQPSTSS
ncbi:MAG: glutamate--cysteine ligase [Phycisphaerae bacterium]|nr:glutamate--cysteine ligase [Phycisphaerae bacterium]|tara:strand:- start:8536 stop:9675 length:1140 start_codon:yes stop_codon:yes gene_type:complete